MLKECNQLELWQPFGVLRDNLCDTAINNFIEYIDGSCVVAVSNVKTSWDLELQKTNSKLWVYI